MAGRQHPTLYQTYGDRSADPAIPDLSRYLLRLMHLKRTNLCVSADVKTTFELLQLAEHVGEHICILKTHADIIQDFTDRTIRGLLDVAQRKKFVIFEDRKFGDIGNTLTEQYSGGPLNIVRWAHITNAHLLFGPDIITSLSQAAQKAIAAHNTSVSTDISASPATANAGASPNGDEEDEDDDDADDGEDTESEFEQQPREERDSRKRSVVSVSTTISTKSEAISPEPSLRPSLSRESTEESEDSEEEKDRVTALSDLGPPPYYRGLLLLAQVSSRGNLVTPEWTAETVKQARANKSFIMGFIAQESLNRKEDDNFIIMTPGVQLAAGGDALGQQYNTPRKVITELGSDIIIVGRGVYGAPPAERRRAAGEYRRQGWHAYEERLKAGRKRR